MLLSRYNATCRSAPLLFRVCFVALVILTTMSTATADKTGLHHSGLRKSELVANSTKVFAATQVTAPIDVLSKFVDTSALSASLSMEEEGQDLMHLLSGETVEEENVELLESIQVSGCMQ
jgi:hypothetical protein